MKQKVWMPNYRPFILGGDCRAPIVVEIDVAGEYDLGLGYSGWLIISPNGKTFVAESETGAIVGNTITEVRQDIATADPEIIRKQIENAKITVSKAYIGTIEEFWKILRG